MLAVRRAGVEALAVFHAGDEHIAAERMNGERMAAILTDVLGENITYRPVSWDAWS